jgi:tRNA-intron endonuclease, archaea type
MKPAKGYLQSTHVIVTDNKDIGRLFQKSSFGIPVKNNKLKLNLIEAVFLIEEKRLNIFDEDENISFDELISYASNLDRFFEEKYLVFRDLRKRGLQVKLSTDVHFTFYYEKKGEQTNEFCVHQIIVISEREIPSLFYLQTMVTYAIKRDSTLWIGLVDEEGDITYYALEIQNLKGNNPSHHYDHVKGIMLSNRVVIFDTDVSDHLHNREFFGKPFGQGLQLSLVEALYLSKQKILTCFLASNPTPLSDKDMRKEISERQHDIHLRYPVFSDLKQRGLIVKTGFKFGTHFRAYQHSPFRSHAEFLIYTIDKNYQTQWPEISRAVRLAHGVNKTLIYAFIKKNRPPFYMSITRIRP